MEGAQFTSGNDAWRTPLWLYSSALLRWGPFDVDACADAKNALVQTFWTDAHKRDWSRAVAGRVWCNPPYSRKAKVPILRRALSFGDLDAVFLVPARTGTAWFAELADRATEIVFLTRRVVFRGAKTGAPFPSALVRIDDLSGDQRRVTFEDWAP